MKLGNNLKKIFNQISTTDLRLKLRFLKKKTKINFYPNNFKITGFGSIYTRVIFFLLMFERFYKEVRIKYRKIFNSNYEYQKIKFINSLPRSGTSFLQNIISSERELSNNCGNGVPKYMSNTDKFIFNDLENKKKIPLNIFEVCYENMLMYDYRYYNKKVESHEYDIFYFSHYPISKSDLISSQDEYRQIYLIREPIASCLSNLKHILNFDKFMTMKSNKIDNIYILKKLDEVCDNYKLFFNHIVSLNNKKEIMIITFDDLTYRTKSTLVKIYNFFKVHYNENFLNKAIEINSKENTVKMLYKNKSVSNRISNHELDKEFEEKIIEKIKVLLEKEIVKYDEKFDKKK